MPQFLSVRPVALMKRFRLAYRFVPRGVALLAVATVSLLPTFSARSEENAQGDRDAAKEASAARLNLMRRRVMSLSAEYETPDGRAKAQIIEAPLLRYNNPAGQIVTLDSAVWAWGRVGRPVALASVEEAGCELVSLADKGVSLTGRSGFTWSPTGSEVKWLKLPAAPAPGESLVIRARQMKEIAKRFSATGHYGKGQENTELRLLDRQLHRYADRDHGLFDGAIFAFVAGTNPEVILLLECRAGKQDRSEWHYAFARLSAGALDARLGNELVWNCPAISEWVASAPYTVGRFGPEDLAPDSDLPVFEGKK
jgi:hypothetical protein